MNKLSQKIAVFASALLVSTSLFGYNQVYSYKNSDTYLDNNSKEFNFENLEANIVQLPDTTTKTGKVIASSLNVRKSASTKSSVVVKVKKGATVTILDSKSGWYKIKTSNNKTGWVSSKYISITKKSTTSKTSLPDTTTKTGKVTASSLNVRKSASTKSSIVVKVKKGATVTILDSKSGWYKIKTSNNKTGWVSSKYITVVLSKKTSSSASNTTTSLSSTSNTTNLSSNSASNTEKNNIINDILTTEGKVSSSELNAIKTNLNKIPTNLLEAVKDSGLKVLLTTKDVKNYYNYSFSGTMTGLFDPMAGKIYISSDVSHINKSTVHEFGHALDLIIGKTNYITLTSEWKSIYKSEKNTASGSYYKSNAQEYFADSFDRYISNPSKLKSSAPKTYKFIDSTIKNL